MITLLRKISNKLKFQRTVLSCNFIRSFALHKAQRSLFPIYYQSYESKTWVNQLRFTRQNSTFTDDEVSCFKHLTSCLKLVSPYIYVSRKLPKRLELKELTTQASDENYNAIYWPSLLTQSQLKDIESLIYEKFPHTWFAKYYVQFYSDSDRFFSDYQQFLIENKLSLDHLWHLVGVCCVCWKHDLYKTAIICNLFQLAQEEKNSDFIESFLICLINFSNADLTGIIGFMGSSLTSKDFSSVASMRFDRWSPAAKQKYACITGLTVLSKKVPQVYKFFMNFIINLAISHNKLLLATALSLKAEVSDTTLTNLVDALLLPDPLNDLFDIDACMKVVQHFHYKISLTQAIQWLDKANVTYDSVTESFPYMLSKVYQFVVANISEEDTAALDTYLKQGKVKNSEKPKSFISKSQQQLWHHLKYNNSSAVYMILVDIFKQRLDLALLDPDLVIALVNNFKRNKNFHGAAEDLVYAIPVLWIEAEKMALCVLEFAGSSKDSDLGKYVLDSVPKPLSKRMLGGLLRYLILMQDNDVVQRTLVKIFKFKQGLDTTEFNAMIGYMFTQNLHDRAFGLLVNNNPKTSTSAYITGLRYMVNTNRIDINIARQLVTKLYDSLYDDLNQGKKVKVKQLKYLSMIYLRYITLNYDLNAAKKVFQKSVLNQDSDIKLESVPNIYSNNLNNEFSVSQLFSQNLADVSEYGRNFMKIPFGVLKQEIVNLRLYIPKTARLLAIKTIADASRKQNNKEISRWCILELLKAGNEGTEILLDYTRRYSHHLREVGFQVPSVKTYKSKTKADIELFPGRNKISTFVNRGRPVWFTDEKLASYRQYQNQDEALKKFWKAQGDKFVEETLERC